MRKFLSVLMALCMLTLLAGCMCETADTRIESDGSGSVTVTVGFSERLVKECDLYDEMEREGFSPFPYGGKIYYGDNALEEFSDPAALNRIFSDAAAKMKDNGSALNMGSLTLEQNGNGALQLTLVCDADTGSADAMERSLAEKAESLSVATRSALRDDLVMRYAFTFPKNVYQLEGPSAGVTIRDNVLSLDLTMLHAGTYRFTTDRASVWTVPELQPTELPSAGIVRARTQTIEIDGHRTLFRTYAVVADNGGETNYVKLRDVAYALSGTKVQFNVDWDGDVIIVPETPYKANGSEMSTPFSGDRSYTKATSATKIYDKSVPFSAIVLTDDQGGDYTYYKLRDLGQVLGFNVSWSELRGIYIESDKPYTAD